MRVLIGITAGIAAYKIPFLIRLLIKQGADVRCIMTPDAIDFVSPLVISTLSKHPVGISFWNRETGEWTNHVEYGEWADVFLIAPCTANTLHKLSQGACDNLLLATYLSMRCKTLVAPAMDLEMYQHPSVQRNISQLISDGIQIIPPDKGELASGLIGEGRLPEPEVLAQFLNTFLLKDGEFNGKTVLITAGPTYEAIDPVRFIGNHSSGKMGFALAQVFLDKGADVILIAGPNHLEINNARLKRIDVIDAHEMLEKVKLFWSKSNIGVFAAAVADYRPKEKLDSKLKKTGEELTLQLVKNPDILEWAGQNKTTGQRILGFALETENGDENAKEKLKRKNADAIILNTLHENDPVFNSETNKVRIFDVHGKLTEIPHASKRKIAEGIANYISKEIV